MAGGKCPEYPHECCLVLARGCVQGVVHGQDTRHTALLEVGLVGIRGWTCGWMTVSMEVLRTRWPIRQKPLINKSDHCLFFIIFLFYYLSTNFLFCLAVLAFSSLPFICWGSEGENVWCQNIHISLNLCLHNLVFCEQDSKLNITSCNTYTYIHMPIYEHMQAEHLLPECSMMVMADSLSSSGNRAFKRRTSSSTMRETRAGRNFVTIWGSNLGSRNNWKTNT